VISSPVWVIGLVNTQEWLSFERSAKIEKQLLEDLEWERSKVLLEVSNRLHLDLSAVLT
jgi:hypothetical protein